jgi:hypothetical protein
VAVKRATKRSGPAWPRVWNGGPAQPQGAPALAFEVEVVTNGEANERSFFGALGRRKKQDAALESALFGIVAPAGPWCVRMTRLAPGAGLDDDNLGGAFKRIRDRLAEWLEVDDREPSVAFCVAQEKRKGPPGVRIEVWGAEGIPR